MSALARIDTHSELQARDLVGVTGGSLRVMAILPASKSRRLLTGSSLLDEEIPAMAERGIEIHGVFHNDIGKQSAVLRRHLLPRIRDARHSFRSALRCVQPHRHDSLCGSSWRIRFQLARAQLGIADVVRSERLQLIHSHWARPSGTAAAMAKDITGVPLVMTLRGADIFTEASIGYGDTLNSCYVKRLQYAFQRADRIIGVSTQIIDRAVELGAEPVKTLVIPKGVHHTRFVPGDRLAAREALGLDDRPMVLFVGALGPWKGIPDLLEAFVTVKRKVHDVQLIFCGKGKLDQEIRAFTADHALDDSIRLMGYIDRATLPTYFQACDVFVLPSLTEGSGNVLLEAAACQRPSVGTRAGGIPDYIDDGQTGLLCGKRDPADLAEKLLAILQDPALAQRMGKRGREKVLENFRYEQMIDRTVAVYEQVLSNGAHGRK